MILNTLRVPQSGWATKLSERVVEEDEFSNVSYVGPDTGTY